MINHIESIQPVLAMWEFRHVPCRSPIDHLIGQGILKSVRSTPRFRLYVKRANRNVSTPVEYWLLLDKALYYTTAISNRHSPRDIANNIEILLDGEL